MGGTTVRPHAGCGRVSEFSVRDGTIFCVCRFGDGFGLMGKMVSPDCRVGLRVVVSRCGMDDSGPFFEFSAAD